ncbi:MAG: class I SAM-dependent methyltransferase [Chlamydiia bacterium]|nr:class I SAM-dependent methyltransferase [Chlamydiia bacterium]
MNNYRSLCTEYYDLVSYRAEEAEVAFYAELLKKLPEPYLEAMCGSGRLLIPLVESGLVIHGVDYSPSMLDSCRCRLKEHLDIELIEASVETMNLTSRYGTIFIAAGSLQLIQRSQLPIALQNLRRHLIPGGVLVLEMWVPWQSLITGEIHDQSKFEVPTSDGRLIKVNVESQMDRDAQRILDKQCYAKYNGDEMVASDVEHLELNWYYRYEMELLLEKAGFIDIEVTVPEHPLVPDSFVCKARLGM